MIFINSINVFYKSFEEITERRKLPFLVGGTGLYLNSILSSYKLKPVDFNTPRAKELNELDLSTLRNILVARSDSLHNTTDLTDKKRIIKAILIAEAERSKDEFQQSISSLTIGVRLPREQIKKRITERLKYRLQNGMIDEVNGLLKKGVTHDKLQFFGLEYKFISEHLKGELNYNDMFQKLNSAIHNFAKRQMTWFRKMEREGIEINWIEGPNVNEAEKIIFEKMES
ncbi:MAG: tRNA dimethylallyltransferase [Melioribacteraceae bacterium]|nr:tRNA dimethylallyltransferase [Melioribacteraceae bacterium]